MVQNVDGTFSFEPGDTVKLLNSDGTHTIYDVKNEYCGNLRGDNYRRFESMDVRLEGVGVVFVPRECVSDIAGLIDEDLGVV